MMNQNCTWEMVGNHHVPSILKWFFRIPGLQDTTFFGKCQTIIFVKGDFLLSTMVNHHLGNILYFSNDLKQTIKPKF